MNEDAASSELSLAVAVARRYYLHDESKVDIARFPKIHDHHKRMAERPAVKRVLAAWR